MRWAYVILLLSSAAAAQTPTPSDVIPDIMVGVGPSWTRGDLHAASVDVDVSFRLGDTNVISWSDISTPVATVPAGSPPLASTITTGVAYIIAQNATGAVSLVAIGQGGVTQVASTNTLSPAFTGSVGVAFRIPKTALYFMPLVRASNPQHGIDGSLVSAIMQPGFRLQLGFWKRK